MKGTIAHILVIFFITHLACADPTVQSVQQTLKNHGFYYGNVTGDKSAETTTAIRRYQIRNGLQVTGELDQETLGALKTSKSPVASQAVSTPAGTPSTGAFADQTSRTSQAAPARLFYEPDRQLNTSPGSSTAYYQSAPRRIDAGTLADVQQQLTSRGYYRGRIDGRHRRGTTAAVRAFQLSSGLPPTGRLDMSTLNALGLPNEKVASPSAVPRPSETWLPVTKFKHGKWKVKWPKNRRPDAEQYADDDGPENGATWDAANRDDYNR